MTDLRAKPSKKYAGSSNLNSNGGEMRKAMSNLDLKSVGGNES